MSARPDKPSEPKATVPDVTPKAVVAVSIAAAALGAGVALAVAGSTDTAAPRSTVTVVQATTVEHRPRARTVTVTAPSPSRATSGSRDSSPAPPPPPQLEVQVTDDLVAACRQGLFAACQSRSGVAVAAVTSGGPAAAAGIRRGDVITDIEGTPVQSTDALHGLLADAGPGARISVGLRAFGSVGGASILGRHTVHVTLSR